MGALLDILLFLAISRAFWKLLSGVTAGMQQPQPRRPPAPPDRGIQMARDPVCGTFVVPERAVALDEGSHTVYFCSTTCRDQYRARPSRTA